MWLCSILHRLLTVFALLLVLLPLVLNEDCGVMEMRGCALVDDLLGRRLSPGLVPSAGGKAVIEEIEKQLKLGPELTRFSKDALYRYGNTSSASIWYILARIESSIGVKRGDRVWQIAFGSGFKCNSAVWRSLRTNNVPHLAWENEQPGPLSG